MNASAEVEPIVARGVAPAAPDEGVPPLDACAALALGLFVAGGPGALAQLCGVHPGTVSAWRAGRPVREDHLAILRALALRWPQFVRVPAHRTRLAVILAGGSLPALAAALAERGLSVHHNTLGAWHSGSQAHQRVAARTAQGLRRTVDAYLRERVSAWGLIWPAGVQ